MIVHHREEQDPSSPRIDVCWTPLQARDQLLREARAGLGGSPKELTPKWFYDARGSALFDEITRLPEYYPTRCELQILRAHAADIARRTQANVLVELGSGTSEKTLTLIDAMRERGRLEAFVPFDVCEPFLVEAASRISARYPGLYVHGVVGDFERHLYRLPQTGRRVVAFLGSTIGNLKPDQRRLFYRQLSANLRPGEWLLLGADLVKDRSVLFQAYNDSRGVTAEFNLNVLSVLNRELHARFIPDHFRHVARWNEEHSWIEMLLEARHKERVLVPELGMTAHFEHGERMRTEVSTKFRPETVENELADAGMMIREWWTDEQGYFSVCLAERV
ncbi:MAG: L-histidine N(alpha)-methyltransferase [Myxococcaceae bacterium]